jgi:hypothetical protein
MCQKSTISSGHDDATLMSVHHAPIYDTNHAASPFGPLSRDCIDRVFVTCKSSAGLSFVVFTVSERDRFGC